MAESDNTMSAAELFDLSLEIEGLLSLVVRREDMVPSEVFQLLNDKTAKFADGIQTLVSQAGGTVSSTVSSRAAQEREFVASLPSLPGLFDSDAALQVGEDSGVNVEEISLAIVAENESAYEVSDSGETDVPVSSHIQLMDMNPAKSDTDKEEENHVDDMTSSAVESAAIEDEAEVAAKEQLDAESMPREGSAPASLFDEDQTSDFKKEVAGSSRPMRHEPGELRRMFTVNDKFRFRRELFGNSDTEFTDTLNLVEALRNYNEAEDYFYNDLAWDAEATEVQEFMAVVNRYFNK